MKVKYPLRGKDLSARGKDIKDINGGVKIYRALMTAVGDPPTVTVLENSLGGTVVWAQNGAAGIYIGTLSGAFTASKTFVFATAGENGGANDGNTATGARLSDNAVQLKFWDAVGGNADPAASISIEIRVYP